MKRKQQQIASAVSATLAVLASAHFASAATSYTDNFDRLTLNGGTYTYNTVVTAGNGGAVTDGSVTAEGLRFMRNGVAETAVPSDGDATGLKYLAGKQDCLTVKPGEGYCRD